MAEDTINEELLEAVKADLELLEEELKVELPKISTQLERINKNLRINPELVHLLSDEQIAPFYQAYMRMAEVEKSVKPKAKGKGRKLKDADSDGNKFSDLL